eukprot:Transcript_13931.p3 GENE.Transcript_13931~~Transcript_13931.p3  ORF type:complete len:105 (+),score=12.87 Transcript_13931:3-317(+)
MEARPAAAAMPHRHEAPFLIQRCGEVGSREGEAGSTDSALRCERRERGTALTPSSGVSSSVIRCERGLCILLSADRAASCSTSRQLSRLTYSVWWRRWCRRWWR